MKDRIDVNFLSSNSYKSNISENESTDDHKIFKDNENY